MYCIIFVTFNKEKANTGEEAIEYVERNIRRGSVRSQGFLPSNDLMGNIIDWYRIGRGKFDYFSKDKHKVSNPNNAIVLTEDSYDELLKVFEQRKREKPNVPWCHVDLEAEEVCADFIGRKWIVVIDGHVG